MRGHVRDELLLYELGLTGHASVSDLAERLSVTAATIRRGLQRLEAQGLVVRTYGGALTAVGDSHRAAQRDPEFEHKQSVGLAASELINDGETIALSSGSTVLALARHIMGRRLTVITNALDVANVLIDAPRIELVLLGGIMLPGLHSLRGHLTELGMAELRADKSFTGVSAVDLSAGFMTEHVLEIAVDRGLCNMGREIIVVADASKFDRAAAGFMFAFDQVSTLVTDDRVRPAVRDSLEHQGMRLVIARSERARDTA